MSERIGLNVAFATRGLTKLEKTGTVMTLPNGGYRMKQRVILVATIVAALLATPLIAAAGDAKVLRVGAVSLRPFGKANISVAFLERMAELGYERGRNFTFEFIQVPNRAAYGQAYRNLVARGVDVLVAGGPEVALKAAVGAAGNLPVVMIAVDYDPLARGYVSSLARPGGNVTGVFFRQIALTKKRLQLMKETVPDVKAITVFWDRNSADQWKAVQTAAALLHYPVHAVEFRQAPYDFDRAFAQVPPRFRGGLMVLASQLFSLPSRHELIEFALRNRLPTIFWVNFYADAGGLMSYGVSFTKLFRRAADYVDRIARGAKPADLPVEQPTEFELVVNLKTARALGITLPPSILLRADQVIE